MESSDVTTIQLTSKKLKAHALVSAISIILGMVGFCASLVMQAPKEVAALLLITIPISVAWYLITAFMIWWRHG